MLSRATLILNIYTTLILIKYNMKKEYIIGTISIAVLAILTCATLEMHHFAAGVVQDSHKNENLNVTNIIQEGDIIFQTSQSSQSKAIQLATHSKYSHVGIVFFIKGRPMVLEAIQPVKYTALAKWIERGEDRRYVIKRLKKADSIPSEPHLEKMKKLADEYLGTSYDYYFEWSDDKLYCSELVWKIIHEGTGLKVGKLQHLSDFDLSPPAVKKIIQKRYGQDVPLEEEVIAPSGIFESELLEEVKIE